jgi:hypothetical protein
MILQLALLALLLPLALLVQLGLFRNLLLRLLLSCAFCDQVFEMI